MREASKQLVLTLTSTLVIVVFFNIGFHSEWLQTKVIAPLKLIDGQLLNMEPEVRLEHKLQNSYAIAKATGDYMRSVGQDKTAIVLLPPQAYLKEQGADFHVPEPVVFYYYSGLRSKWINSPGADSATHVLGYHTGQMALLPLGKEFKKEILATYRQYKIQ